MKNNSVKLISITKPLIEEADTAEDLIAYLARVSNPKNQNNKETAPKLIKYLYKHKHWSPFEMVDLCMEIITTRDIGRQIIRHGKGFSFQEFSQRYSQVSDESFVIREARLQDKQNRQNSIETNDEILKKMWILIQEKHLNNCRDLYNWAIDNGIAKEQTRVILPEGMTLSKMYMKGNLRSWIHYILVRTEIETQKEHRIIANKCKEIVLIEFPSLKELFCEQ